MVPADSPLACIRCARAALEALSALAPDSLPPHPSCLPCCRAALPPQLQFKFGEARQHASDHPARGVGGVDAFTKGAQHDSALAKLADCGHHLRSVAAQTVNADHHDSVALTGVVEERS